MNKHLDQNRRDFLVSNGKQKEYRLNNGSRIFEHSEKNVWMDVELVY